MKQQIFLFIPILFVIACNDVSEKEATTNEKTKDSTEAISYSRNDLGKIKWIEGSWKGMYKNEPFYEIYKLVGDTLLEVTSYDWNGKDSSNTSKTYVHWNDSAYYLGDKLNWKVVSITDSQINMKRNYKASNDIIWKFHDADSWDAVLEHNKGVDRYHMERVGKREGFGK